MDREQMIESVYTDGYLESFLRGSLRNWMDIDDFRQELALATCIAADRYSPDKGKWRSWVYWYWRSVRSVMHRNYMVRQQYKIMSIHDEAGEGCFEVADRSRPVSLDLMEIERIIGSLPYIEQRMVLATTGDCIAEFGMSRDRVCRLRRRVRKNLLKSLGKFFHAS